MDTPGKRIRALREAKGLTQTELGQRVGGFSRQAVGMWEHDEREPDYDTLKAIARELNSTVAYILLGAASQAERLKALRQRSQLSQEELAGRAEVSADLIAQVEAGKAYLTGLDLVKVATALGVNAAFLEGTSDEPQIKTKLPPELEQLVDEIMKGGWTVEDVRTALKILGLARGKPQEGRSEP